MQSEKERNLAALQITGSSSSLFVPHHLILLVLLFVAREGSFLLSFSPQRELFLLPNLQPLNMCVSTSYFNLFHLNAELCYYPICSLLACGIISPILPIPHLQTHLSILLLVACENFHLLPFSSQRELFLLSNLQPFNMWNNLFAPLHFISPHAPFCPFFRCA